MAKRTAKSGSGTLSLPTEPVVPSEDLSDHFITIYGRKGVGKSTLASSFPNSVNLRFERGRGNLPGIYQVPDPVRDKGKRLTWENFLSLVEELADSDFTTVVIDSADKCYDQCFAFVCKQAGCKHPSEKNDYGETWSRIQQEYTIPFDFLMDCGKQVVFVSHEKVRTDSMADDTEYERYDLTLAPKAQDIVKERCEFVLHYGYSRNNRVITVRNADNTIFCSCGRPDRFLQPDGVPVERFAMPDTGRATSPEEVYRLNYETLLAAYNNELNDYDYKPPREKKKFVKKSS